MKAMSTEKLELLKRKRSLVKEQNSILWFAGPAGSGTAYDLQKRIDAIDAKLKEM